MVKLTNSNMDLLKVHHETYLGQIKDALNVNGGDVENATGSDYVLHFFTFGWKVRIINTVFSILSVGDRLVVIVMLYS